MVQICPSEIEKQTSQRNADNPEFATHMFFSPGVCFGGLGVCFVGPGSGRNSSKATIATTEGTTKTNTQTTKTHSRTEKHMGGELWVVSVSLKHGTGQHECLQDKQCLSMPAHSTT